MQVGEKLLPTSKRDISAKIIDLALPKFDLVVELDLMRRADERIAFVVV